MNPHRPCLNVLVAYEDPLVSIGLRTVFNERADTMLVDASSLHGRYIEPRVDVVVADLLTGLRIATESRRLARSVHTPATRVLVITPHDREEDVRAALDAGIEGYIVLGSPVQSLIDAVRSVAAGKRHLCAQAAQRIADSLTRASLTARERQVLGLVAAGRSNKDISADLEISLSTVKAHVKALLDKLGASSRTQATSIAVSRGLIAAASLPNPQARPASASAARPPTRKPWELAWLTRHAVWVGDEGNTASAPTHEHAQARHPVQAQ